MNWEFKITEPAQKQLRDIGPSGAATIIAYVEKHLRGCENPRALGKPLRGDMHGLWRYRVADYRLICRLDDGLLIIALVKVGNRKNVYKKKN